MSDQSLTSPEVLGAILGLVWPGLLSMHVYRLLIASARILVASPAAGFLLHRHQLRARLPARLLPSETREHRKSSNRLLGGPGHRVACRTCPAAGGLEMGDGHRNLESLLAAALRDALGLLLRP